MVNLNKNIAFVIGIMCFVLGTYSCGFIPIYKYKDLTCYNKQFVSGQIRTDGYYSTNYNDTLCLDVMCFYEDGFYLCIMNDYTDDTTMTNYLRKNSKVKTKWQTKKGWGVYHIENDTLTMQEFSSGRPPKIYALTFEHFSVIQLKGAIINSEMFTTSDYSFRGKSEKINDTYQFHPCVDCKPDATNWNWLRTNKKLNKLYPKKE